MKDTNNDGHVSLPVCILAGLVLSMLVAGCSRESDSIGTERSSPSETTSVQGTSVAGSSVLTNLTKNELAYDSGPIYSPDGKKIAFTKITERRTKQNRVRQESEIYAMNADGSGQVNLTNNEVSDGSYTWSSDGTRIAFDTVENGGGGPNIFVAQADGTGKTKLTNSEEVMNLAPTFVPNGTKIAFQRCTIRQEYTCDIYVMNADGSGQENLTKTPAITESLDSATFSPDGKKLVFQGLNGTMDDLYEMNVDGTDRIKLTNDQVSDDNPVWSPEGTKIAFLRTYKGASDVFVMTAKGSIRLTTNKTMEDFLTWSPDGTKIAFTSDVDGDADIYIMNADGTNQINFTANGANDGWPTWSPDGTKIAFTSDVDGDADIYVINVTDTK